MIIQRLARLNAIVKSNKIMLNKISSAGTVLKKLLDDRATSNAKIPDDKVMIIFAKSLRYVQLSLNDLINSSAVSVPAFVYSSRILSFLALASNSGLRRSVILFHQLFFIT